MSTPSTFSPDILPKPGPRTFGRRHNVEAAPPAVQQPPPPRAERRAARSPNGDRRVARLYNGDRRAGRVAVPETPSPEKPILSLPEELLQKNACPRLRQYKDVLWKTITDMVDVVHLARLEKDVAVHEISQIVSEISRRKGFSVSEPELQHLCKFVADEMLGFGPLEDLLARDDIDEIMVNGPGKVYVEIKGLVEKSPVTFRDEKHLIAICQRIVARVGRHVDEASPICDARLPDGSRVNIILPPLALDGTLLTIRKFSRQKMSLEKMIELGSLDACTAELLRLIAACRASVLVSGGTGSGKTTLLNCLTRHINSRERIVTCEDAAELQLQQTHVLRLETRPPGIEGTGAVTMRDLVRNCLRMRPERIIVGEVRGAEAFDLLSAMSTGHDGSMGTIHANTPRDALSRLESMIALASLNVPAQTMRQQIASAVNVIIQVQRLHDGSRKIVSISEVTGMEGDIVSLQDLVTFQQTGEDANGRITGVFKPSKLKPRFYDRLKYSHLEERYLALMERFQGQP